MKVTAGSWPQSTGSYKTTLRQEDIKNDREYASEMETDPFTDPDMDALSESLKALSSKNSEKSGSGGFKAKASAPDDSVGQLASMLASAGGLQSHAGSDQSKDVGSCQRGQGCQKDCPDDQEDGKTDQTDPKEADAPGQGRTIRDTAAKG